MSMIILLLFLLFCNLLVFDAGCTCLSPEISWDNLDPGWIHGQDRYLFKLLFVLLTAVIVALNYEGMMFMYCTSRHWPCKWFLTIIINNDLTWFKYHNATLYFDKSRQKYQSTTSELHRFFTMDCWSWNWTVLGLGNRSVPRSRCPSLSGLPKWMARLMCSTSGAEWSWMASSSLREVRSP